MATAPACSAWIKVQTIAVVLNFLINLILITLIVLGVLSLHVKANDLGINTNSTRAVMEKTNSIVDSVRAVSANMVPLSSIALNSTEDMSRNNNSFAQAATGVMVGMGRADWVSFLSNTTVAVGAVGDINFTVITDFLRMGQNETLQETVKKEINRMLGSVEAVQSSATNMLTTYRQGILTEDRASRVESKS